MFGPRDKTDEILQRHLDADFWSAAADDNAPSKRQLMSLAARYNCKLPREFVVHSTGRLGGIYIEVKEEVWPRPKEYEVGPFWSFLYGMFVYGLAPEIPDWMNIELAAEKFRASTGHSRIPCLKVVGDADIYVFDAEGRISQWQHETGELELFEGSFFDLLEQEVADLRKRKDQKVALNAGEC